LEKPVVEFAGSAAFPDQFPTDGLAEVAFLGRSNVGKSSLLNALVGQKGLARVSQTPGRTRLVNFFKVDDCFYLADLPGYGYSSAPREVSGGWDALVSAYLARETLALCLVLLDVRHEPTEGDRDLLDYLDSQGLAYACVATKADKLATGELKRRCGVLGERIGSVLPVSATKGTGLKALWNTIRAAAKARAEAM